MDVTEVPTSDLATMAAPYNPRQISDHDLEALRRSLRYFGTVEPIVVNKRSGRIVGGHQRVKAAQAESMVSMPVVYVDLDDPSEKQLNLALNRIHGEWEPDLLADLLRGLEAEGADLALTGFAEDELARLMAEANAGLTDPDDAPELQADAVTQLGELIVMGKHRLLCGDATNAGAVSLLLGDVKPNLMVTDPPYGVEYDGGAANATKRQKIEGDDSADLFGPALMLAAKHMPIGAWYVWHAGRVAAPVYFAIAHAGFEVRSLLIWNKLKAHYGAPSAHYCQKHEPCLYAVRGSASFSGPSNECTVWDIDQHSRNEFHPTQKPVECMARAIRNHDAPQVYDPFLGSGTTIIAAEMTGRACYGLELDPRYCDVIVKRWQDFTGKKAEGWRGNG